MPQYGSKKAHPTELLTLSCTHCPARKTHSGWAPAGSRVKVEILFPTLQQPSSVSQASPTDVCRQLTPKIHHGVTECQQRLNLVQVTGSPAADRR